MGENRQMGRHQAHSPLLNRRRFAADDLTRAPGFATAPARRDRRDEIAAIIQAWTGPRPKAEVVRLQLSETEIFMGLLGHSREDLERWRAEGVI